MRGILWEVYCNRWEVYRYQLSKSRVLPCLESDLWPGMRGFPGSSPLWTLFHFALHFSPLQYTCILRCILERTSTECCHVLNIVLFYKLQFTEFQCTASVHHVSLSPSQAEPGKLDKSPGNSTARILYQKSKIWELNCKCHCCQHIGYCPDVFTGNNIKQSKIWELNYKYQHIG